jgi:endonuclease III
LANTRSRTIKGIVESLITKFGIPTLAPLTKMTDKEAEQFLISLPGVGMKVARCVLMYSLGRAVFPVDTHCWRIAYRLGWVGWKSIPSGPTRYDMDRLQELIPAGKRFSLHVNMVSHGRKICTARNPKCWECPLKDICPKIGVKGHHRVQDKMRERVYPTTSLL